MLLPWDIDCMETFETIFFVATGFIPTLAYLYARQGWRAGKPRRTVVEPGDPREAENAV
jgi:hypothetical protein